MSAECCCAACVHISLCISCFSNAVRKHCDQDSLQKKAFHWAYSFKERNGRVKAWWQEQLGACNSESQVESKNRELEVGGGGVLLKLPNLPP